MFPICPLFLSVSINLSAVGDVLSGEGIKEYPGKLIPFVTVTCIVAAIGGLILGYDIAISVTNFKSISDFLSFV